MFGVGGNTSGGSGDGTSSGGGMGLMSNTYGDSLASSSRSAALLLSELGRPAAAPIPPGNVPPSAASGSLPTSEGGVGIEGIRRGSGVDAAAAASAASAGALLAAHARAQHQSYFASAASSRSLLASSLSSIPHPHHAHPAQASLPMLTAAQPAPYLADVPPMPTDTSALTEGTNVDSIRQKLKEEEEQLTQMINIRRKRRLQLEQQAMQDTQSHPNKRQAVEGNTDNTTGTLNDKSSHSSDKQSDNDIKQPAPTSPSPSQPQQTQQISTTANAPVTVNKATPPAATKDTTLNTTQIPTTTTTDHSPSHISNTVQPSQTSQSTFPSSSTAQPQPQQQQQKQQQQQPIINPKNLMPEMPISREEMTDRIKKYILRMYLNIQPEDEEDDEEETVDNKITDDKKNGNDKEKNDGEKSPKENNEEQDDGDPSSTETRKHDESDRKTTAKKKDNKNETSNENKKDAGNDKAMSTQEKKSKADSDDNALSEQGKNEKNKDSVPEAKKNNDGKEIASPKKESIGDVEEAHKNDSDRNDKKHKQTIEKKEDDCETSVHEKKTIKKDDAKGKAPTGKNDDKDEKTNQSEKSDNDDKKNINGIKIDKSTPKHAVDSEGKKSDVKKNDKNEDKETSDTKKKDIDDKIIENPTRLVKKKIKLSPPPPSSSLPPLLPMDEEKSHKIAQILAKLIEKRIFKASPSFFVYADPITLPSRIQLHAVSLGYRLHRHKTHKQRSLLSAQRRKCLQEKLGPKLYSDVIDIYKELNAIRHAGSSWKKSKIRDHEELSARDAVPPALASLYFPKDGGLIQAMKRVDDALYGTTLEEKERIENVDWAAYLKKAKSTLTSYRRMEMRQLKLEVEEVQRKLHRSQPGLALAFSP